MDNSHPLLPGPRPPSEFISPSYPPAPRRWSLQPPMSQSRGGYTSPDPSPTGESPFGLPDHRTAFFQSDYFRSPDDQPPMPIRQHPPPPMGAQKQGNIVHPQQDGGYYSGLQQRPVGGAHAKKGRAVRKVDGKQPTFLTKLYQILEQPEYHHIIRWDEAGEVIIIEKPEELADKILPLVYRQSRFASFSRQLNIYGFMRKVSLRHVDRGICDPDASTWSHPFLRRSSTSSEIQGFKRRVPPRPSQAAKCRASMASNYSDISQGLSPTSSEGSYPSPDAHRQHYLQDLDEEKPAIFASPPEHVMPIDEDISPKSGHYHYVNYEKTGMPPDGIAMPAIPTPLAHMGHNFFMDRSQTAMPADIPASAPAHISNFVPHLRIAQGHIRTRSVQGEPPSASLFSPLSPLGQPMWNTPETEMVTEDAVLPAYTVNQQDFWSRPAFQQPAAPIPQQMADRGFAAASVPSDFAPTPFNPSLGPSAAAHDMSQIQAHPTTISPGVYQDGFAVPSHKATYVPTAPQAFATNRHERRASISSSPYSPRSKAPGHLSLSGVVRGVSGRKGSSGGPEELGAGDAVTVRSRRSVDEALPSAGIWDLHQGPFDGFFGEKVD